MEDVHARFMRSARAAEAPRPRGRAASRRRDPRQPPQRGPRPHRARARGAARLRQDHARGGACSPVPCPTTPTSSPSSSATSPRPCASASSTSSGATRCGASSSPPRWSTGSSTGPAPRSRSASRRRPARRAPTSCAAHEAARAIVGQPDALARHRGARPDRRRRRADRDVPRVAQAGRARSAAGSCATAGSRCRSRPRSSCSPTRSAGWRSRCPAFARGAEPRPAGCRRARAHRHEGSGRARGPDRRARPPAGRARHHRARRGPYRRRRARRPSCTP